MRIEGTVVGEHFAVRYMAVPFDRHFQFILSTEAHDTQQRNYFQIAPAMITLDEKLPPLEDGGGLRRTIIAMLKKLPSNPTRLWRWTDTDDAESDLEIRGQFKSITESLHDN